METAEALLTDLSKLCLAPKPGAAALQSALCAQAAGVVGYEDWQKIDVAERGRGQVRGKAREKIRDYQRDNGRPATRFALSAFVEASNRQSTYSCRI
jgi:hypothetical protein